MFIYLIKCLALYYEIKLETVYYVITYENSECFKIYEIHIKKIIFLAFYCELNDLL